MIMAVLYARVFSVSVVRMVRTNSKHSSPSLLYCLVMCCRSIKHVALAWLDSSQNHFVLRRCHIPLFFSFLKNPITLAELGGFVLSISTHLIARQKQRLVSNLNEMVCNTRTFFFSFRFPSLSPLLRRIIIYQWDSFITYV